MREAIWEKMSWCSDVNLHRTEVCTRFGYVGRAHVETVSGKVDIRIPANHVCEQRGGAPPHAACDQGEGCWGCLALIDITTICFAKYPPTSGLLNETCTLPSLVTIASSSPISKSVDAIGGPE